MTVNLTRHTATIGDYEARGHDTDDACANLLALLHGCEESPDLIEAVERARQTRPKRRP